MEALSVREYRNNLSASFDRANNGETVLIKRKNQYYTLTCVGNEELMLTPELEQRIEDARTAFKAGKTISCKTKEELDQFLNSL